MHIFVISFIIFIVIGVPVAFSMGLSSLTYILIYDAFPFSTMVQRMTTATESWPLMAIPFFILLGQFITSGKMGERFLGVFNSFVGHIRGGLAHVSIVASMFFAGVSGSSVADAAGIGSVLIPEMEKKGYDTTFSVAINATSSVVGVIIPPSIPMIVYGWMTNVSIRSLFIGGLVPGVLIGLVLMLITWRISVNRDYPTQPKAPLKKIFQDLKDNILILLTPIIVLGSIMFGIMSTTESALVGVVYALILQMFVYKNINWKNCVRIFKDSARTTGTIVYLIATSMIVSYILSYEGIPQLLGDYILSTTDNKLLIVMGMNIVLLVMGAVMDFVPNVMIFTPIFYPIALQIGFDPVQFGVMMTVNLAIGLFTPPVGNCLYISSLIGKIPIEQGAKACIPFFIGIIFILILISTIPALTLWLPNLLF